MTKLMQGVETAGLGVYLKKDSVLVFGDLHIGYEEALNKQGLLIPRSQLDRTLAWVEKAIKRFKPRRIIINGDLKHEFGTISNQEWHDTLVFLDMLEKHAEVTIIRGNHDKILGPIAKRKSITIKDYVVVDGFLVCHGDKIITEKSDAVIIGHEHPSITIRRGARCERFKCFLKGKWKGRDLLVLPSTNPLVEGTDISREKPMGPFISDYSDMRVYVIDDNLDVLDFGKTSKIPS